MFFVLRHKLPENFLLTMAGNAIMTLRTAFNFFRAFPSMICPYECNTEETRILNIVTKSTVNCSVKSFKVGRVSTDEKACSSSPPDSVNDETIGIMHVHSEEDWWQTVQISSGRFISLQYSDFCTLHTNDNESRIQEHFLVWETEWWHICQIWGLIP